MFCITVTILLIGAHGGAVVEALRYKPEGRGIEKKIPMVPLKFFY
jgi:hypothetical protein